MRCGASRRCAERLTKRAGEAAVVNPTSEHSGDERLLTFEIAQSLYALPISGVVEVAEVEEDLAAIPTLAAEVGGVINFHGDALPVLLARALLGVDGAEPKTPMQIIVITDRPSEQARLGLPVDEILGLVDGPRVRCARQRPGCGAAVHGRARREDSRSGAPGRSGRRSDRGKVRNGDLGNGAAEPRGRIPRVTRPNQNEKGQRHDANSCG